MEGVPAIVWFVLLGGLLSAGVSGMRGLRCLRDSVQSLELDQLSSPPHWLSTRAFIGMLAAFPVVVLARPQGPVALLSGGVVGLIAYVSAPWFLADMRKRLERRILDDLASHLDLLAVALEAGRSWSAALALCVERAPGSPLSRAWRRVWLDIQAGTEPLEALRALEQRLRLQPLTTLLNALRAAEKLKRPAAEVLRERARHCASARFARAERRARAAPLKLWAAMLLCLLPCTAAVLAYPLADFLARIAG